MIRASTLAALAFAMSSVPAMADPVPLPSIDGARYCNAVSGFLNASSPGADLIRDGCLKTESDYSEKLLKLRPSVSDHAVPTRMWPDPICPARAGSGLIRTRRRCLPFVVSRSNVAPHHEAAFCDTSSAVV